MSRMPDNYDLWEQHQAEQDKQLESCDICSECGNPIQDDHYYNINGDLWCPNCIDDCRHWY
jgi:formylmethanofuran dehydrogenase subunit E